MSDIKVPPHSEEAERSVLGCVLIDRNALVDVVDKLSPEMFYQQSHNLIFECVVELYADRNPVDVVTVADKLKEKKALKKVGGNGYLTELAANVPTSAHAEKYAEIVRGYSIKRQMITLAAELNEMALEDGGSIEGLLDRAEKNVFALSQKNIKRDFVPVREALSESFDRLDELQRSEGGLRGVPTGFADLDNALAGMQESNLLILAARPGMGKTTLALNLAQYASVEKKIPVGMFSLEMSNLELVDRLLVSQANIDAWKMKTGNLSEKDFESLSEAMGILADSPIYIDDSPGQSILEMRTKARRLQAEHGIKMIIVDYLQLAVGSGKFDSRATEVQSISQGLKNLARELKIPVLALSQLNRSIETRGDKVPQLSDLRESGSIEQDADVVMFLFRSEDENLEDYKLNIAKHRNGPLKTVDFKFKGNKMRFFGIDKKS
jgi:replicative DNA helicase